jgi:two-component system, response regulator
MTADVAGGNQIEILLVEDDPADIELIVHALKAAHLANRIEIARRAEQALDFLFCRGAFRARNPDSRPKLILLDIKLPNVDGLEALRQIREHPGTRAIPVVVLTSSRQESDLARSYALGANSYIQKPVDFDGFRATIRQIAHYWLLANQAPPQQAFTAPRSLGK